METKSFADEVLEIYNSTQTDEYFEREKLERLERIKDIIKSSASHGNRQEKISIWEGCFVTCTKRLGIGFRRDLAYFPDTKSFSEFLGGLRVEETACRHGDKCDHGAKVYQDVSGKEFTSVCDVDYVVSW